MNAGSPQQMVDDEEAIYPAKKRKNFSSLFFLKVRTYRWVAIVICFIIFVILVAVFVNQGSTVTDEYVAVKATNGAVAAQDQRCSTIGVEMLKKGGSAVDAAIATSLCVGVVNSFSSGIGGGGFMLVYNSSTKASSLIDFREEAPAAAFPEMFVNKSAAATLGGLSVAVPGEIRGMEVAWKRFGLLPWKDLFQPSIDLARNGYEVSTLLAERLDKISTLILSDAKWGAIYAPEGKVLVKGDTAINLPLAATLETISLQGADALYNGTLAATIAAEINAAGGNYSASDFSNFKVKDRKIVSTFYHGRKIITGGPPTSGPVLLAFLNILERYNIPKTGLTTDIYQAIVESFKFGFAQRSYLADPDFMNITVDVTRMISKDWAALIRNNISMTHTYSASHYGSNYEVEATPGTSHISIIDKNRNAVSLTSTINLAWGSQIMSSTGIILNNQMDDFSTPGVTNSFGLKPSPVNFIAPGKRPLSSSSPVVVVKDGEVELVAGGSGGTRIVTHTAQVILQAIDLDNEIMDAIKAPRMHHQLYPNTLILESDFPTASWRALQDNIGHQIERLDKNIFQGMVQAIRVSGSTLYAASDPRKLGRAAGY